MGTTIVPPTGTSASTNATMPVITSAHSRMSDSAGDQPHVRSANPANASWYSGVVRG